MRSRTLRSAAVALVASALVLTACGKSKQTGGGASATTAALRKLYEGLHVTRDADNRYRPVADAKIGRDDSRREVLRRIIRSLGVTSAEALAAYTRFEYNMGETRLRLREFEAEGWLVKGFLARGERTVMWAVKDGLGEIGQADFRRKFVLTPSDNLFLYLREAIDRKSTRLNSSHS